MPESSAVVHEWLHGKAGVLAERNFRTFYIGYVTSLLGTSMSAVAIAWAVLQSTRSAPDLGYVMAANVVPQILLLAVAGAVADRLGRRRVMLAADALRCCAQAGLAAAVFAGRPPLWLFLVLAGIRGSGEAFFSPALGALTVEVSPASQLGNANALYGLAQSATRIGGPALSGVIVAVAGPASVIAADAASYAVSVAALSLLKLPATEPGARGTLFRDMADGWSDFRSRTWLWVVSLQWAFFNLISWSPWMVLGPVMGRDYLGGPAVWGAIMAAQGAGAIAGGLACLGRRPRRPIVVATIAMFGYTMPDIPLALHATALWVGLAAFACGIGSALSGTYFGAAMQQQVPADRLARVTSLSLFSSYGIGVVGYGIDGPLAGVVGAQAVFGIGAAYGILSSIAVLCLPAIYAVRWQDTQDTQDTQEATAGRPTGERRTPSAGRRP